MAFMNQTVRCHILEDRTFCARCCQPTMQDYRSSYTFKKLLLIRQTCVKRHIVACSPQNCCKETQQYVHFYVVGVNVAVNNVKVFSVVKEVHQWASFAMLLSCKMFRTAVNNVTKILFRKKLKAD